MGGLSNGKRAVEIMHEGALAQRCANNNYACCITDFKSRLKLCSYRHFFTLYLFIRAKICKTRHVCMN